MSYAGGGGGGYGGYGGYGQQYQQPDYSTLEVDTRTGADLPEVYESRETRENYAPQVYDQNLPEFDASKPQQQVLWPKYGEDGTPATATAWSSPQSQHTPVMAAGGVGAAAAASEGGAIPFKDEGLIPAEKQPGDGRGGRICGMKKKAFFLVLGVGILAIIAIVVGVAVGVSVSSSDDPPPASTSSTSSSPDTTTTTTSTSPSATQDPMAISPKSNVATTSFVDENGKNNHIVVYQLNSGALQMSTWNDDNGRWVVSPVANGQSGIALDDVTLGTSLSVDVWVGDPASTTTVLHVYWLSPTNVIQSLKLDGAQTSTATSADDWYLAPASDTYITSPGSRIMSYGRECPGNECAQWSYLWWQKTDSSIEGVGLEPGGTWQSVGVAGGDDWDVDPTTNTSLALTNVRADPTDGWRAISMFYRSRASGALAHINFERNSADGLYYDGGDLPRKVGERASIVAFTTGTNDTDSSEPVGFHVLTHDPDADEEGDEGGVRLTYLRDDEWTAFSGEVEALAECAKHSRISVNQADRVYCLVDGEDGGVAIKQWTWLGKPQGAVGSYTLYESVGTVGTTQSSS